MQEAIAQIFSYIWGAWRFRWLALGVAWAVAAAGWIFVSQMPEAYVASAKVYVDSNNLLRPLLRGLAVQPNTEQRIALMSRTLLTRPNLEKVMRMTDLDLEVKNDRQKEDALDELRDDIELAGEADNASVYSIRVQNESSAMAKRVAQALITVFIEGSLSDKRESSSGAEEFLEDQIADYESRLEQAEKRLAEFKQRNVGILPGEGEDYYSKLNQAKQDLSEAQLQLRELENRRAELKRQIEGEEPVFLASSESAASSPLDERIQTLKTQKDALLTKYTPLHPQVRQIQGLIDQLEAEKRTEQEKVLAGDYTGAYMGITSSPVYQGMRSMLAETDAKAAELRVRVAEYTQRVEKLEKMVDQVPVIEAELKQLDRDYGVIAKQHQELVERREAAKLSQDVEQNASDVTFRVIDPPFVPSKPSEPNKLLLNSGVLVLALVLGVGLALLISLVKPVVVDERSLARLAGLPLLGSVMLIPTPQQKKQEAAALAMYALLFAGLIFAYVGLNLGQVIILS